VQFLLVGVQGILPLARRERPDREIPVARLKGGNVDLDRRHDRRELDLDELARVLTAARDSAITFRGMTGVDRFHLYLAAVGTGFRAGELAVLRPESFRFGPPAATVTLPAAAEKNRKGSTQPLPPGVAAALQTYVVGRPAGRPVWPGTWSQVAVDLLRIDLDAAGVPYKVAGPDGQLFADFHSLRHSFITLLARSGVAPKEAQRLARHGDIRLTLQRYTHLGLDDLTMAVGRLPAIVENPGATPAAEFISIPADQYAAVIALAAAGLTLLGGEFSCTNVAQALPPTGDDSGRNGTAAGAKRQAKKRHKP
jgi:integrase